MNADEYRQRVKEGSSRGSRRWCYNRLARPSNPYPIYSKFTTSAYEVVVVQQIM